MSYIIGVDIGASNIRVALGDEKANIISKLKERTDKSSGSLGISLQIIRMIRSFKKTDDIRCVGIGSAGPIDLKKGAIVHPTNIDFDFIPIVDPLESEFNIPVYMVKDCAAGVIGEKDLGYGKKYANVVYITLSSGIGGGTFVDGRLLQGKDGNASEIGHIVVDHEGKLTCGCGKRGHWEAYCGGHNLVNFINLQLQSETSAEIKSSNLYKISKGELNKLSDINLFNSAQKKDNLAMKIIGEVGRLNAIGFATVTNIYDPELIVVGGGIALNNPNLVLGPIKKYIGLYNINRIPSIKLTKFGEDVILYGALRLSKYIE